MAERIANPDRMQDDASPRGIGRAPKARRTTAFAINHNLRIDAPRTSRSGAGRPSTDARTTR